ncbi:MAG: GGDEF domain-containing protein [Clostridium sp.]|nr:GGDEF domain-containing protein [Clostridium sp.]
MADVGRVIDSVRHLIKFAVIQDKYTPGKQYIDNSFIIKAIETSLEKNKTVVVLYFDITKFHEIEQLGGTQIASRVLTIFKNTLEKTIPDIFKDADLLAVENLLGDDFVVLLSLREELNYATLQDAAVASRISIKESIKKEMLKIIGEPLGVHVGYAMLNTLSGCLESRFYNAVREAKGIAKGTIDLQTVQLLSEFKSLLHNANFVALYQPIVSLRWGSVLGWEALTRGPANSHFRSPDIIFSFAEEAGLLFPLEKVCRQAAVHKLGEIRPDQKLFINIHPRTINDPNFVHGETIKLIKEAGLEPANIVFEITERQSIQDFALFNRTLRHYRDQGFLVAVDDAGAGFSCLQSIAEIRPDFIKIDMSLVRNIHRNSVKRSLLETFVVFAEKIGCMIIAEGIEKEEEFNALVNIGVHYGQGYYLGYPEYPKQSLTETFSLKIFGQTTNGRNRAWKYAFPVEKISENAVVVDKKTLVRDVRKLFDKDDKLLGIVVAENGQPAGLIMRNNLYSYLSMQYGIPLYSERPISLIMDHASLILDGETPIETASQAAMSREKAKLYDYIIITKNETLHGVVSVQTLLDTMTKIRMEIAKGASPLTGLPGNIAIEQELDRLANQRERFYMVYIDLDNFKAYNDKYGFERGDRVLLFTSRLLNSILRKFGEQKSFLGHIGGDDFVVIIEKADANLVDEICNKIVRYFSRLVKAFYDNEDCKDGKICGYDRDGNQKSYPFMSISLVVIGSSEDMKTDPKSISEKVAQLKRYAKSVPGSIIVKDRRTC